ncbi:DUF5327 family protein [Staphylococcus sp. SQ8-PEA]|uniref:DUF5327 family protein n=1 Tax=Staphylococcus marylandisciuri TaxID=2981529 RepID=A0ABT2QS89_9STAP|nr:DUF5327 family protein [Staphylococcus marylandisciuri]MCU5746861.1 DUF5327 family protein [Staphylococcus marylandisciuri]
MNKDKLIQLIEDELLEAEEAEAEHEFEKHMYAIHALTSLYANEKTRHYKMQNHQHSQYNDKQPIYQTSLDDKHHFTLSQRSSTTNDVTIDEIKAMGGKVPEQMKSTSDTGLPSNKMVTDDEIGNGDSIFDF